MTPHGSQIATTVAILSPLFAKNSRLGYFFNAKSPQGESYGTESVETITKKEIKNPKTYHECRDLFAFEAINDVKNLSRIGEFISPEAIQLLPKFAKQI